LKTFLPETAARVKALLPNASGAINTSDEVKDKILELVLDDAHGLASAAWFYSTKCGDNRDVVEGLQAATLDGWERYITDCVETTVTDERRALWQRTLDVLSA
jgi:hypothetical protein